MNLYVATFRADAPKAGQEKTDHEVVLFAENVEEARQRAEGFFALNGYWAKRYNVATMQIIAGSVPRFIGIQEIPTSSIFYNGNLFDGVPPFNPKARR